MELLIGERDAIDHQEPFISTCQHLSPLQTDATSRKRCPDSVAAVTAEVETESMLLPIFIPMPKKDAFSGLAAIKEALTLCNDRNLRQITGSRGTCIQADGGGELNKQKIKDLCFDKSITLSFSPAHQPSSNGQCRERMVRVLKTTVRRLLKHAHLDRPWWSHACKFAGLMMREKVLGRTWSWPLFGQLV